jgi:anti-sigma B factor antagonist
MTAQTQPFTAAYPIQLGGEIDLANASPIGDALCAALDRAVTPVLVDLSQVSFIDSSGIAMMLRVHKHAVASHRMVWWQGVQPGPSTVFEICALDQVLNFVDWPETKT